MINFIQHVQYTVFDLDEAVAFMEQNFGMKPDRMYDRSDGSGAEAIFKMGEAEIQIYQPNPVTKNGIEHCEFLKKHGAGVHHVALAVDNAEEMIPEWIAKGHKLRHEGKVKRSHHGYQGFLVDSLGPLGGHMQIVSKPKDLPTESYVDGGVPLTTFERKKKSE